MIKYYLLLLCAMVLMALQFVLNKFYQSKNGSALLTSLLYTTLCGLCAGVLFFFINGGQVQITWFSLLCAIGISALSSGYTLLGFHIFALGSFSIFTMFLMLGGMLHQIASVSKIVDEGSFVVIANLANSLISGIVLAVLCAIKKKKPVLNPAFPTWQLSAVVAGNALCNGVSYLLQLIVAASSLPASVQYPIITGGSVVLTALAGAVVFKERPGKIALIGTLLSFTATFLFLI